MPDRSRSPRRAPCRSPRRAPPSARSGPWRSWTCPSPSPPRAPPSRARGQISSRELLPLEDGHLGRWSGGFILAPYGEITHPVAEVLRHAVTPRPKLLPVPLETMVSVAELACWQGLEVGVVLGVGGRQDHGARPGEAE